MEQCRERPGRAENARPPLSEERQLCGHTLKRFVAKAMPKDGVGKIGFKDDEKPLDLWNEMP